MAEKSKGIVLKPALETPTAQEFDPEYVIRIRRFKSGNFSNLWEATLLDPKGCSDVSVLTVLDDANALNFVMDNVQGHIESEGF